MEGKREGRTTINLGQRSDIRIAEKFRTPAYVDRVVKEEVGDPFTRSIISDLSEPEKKLKMRRRVFSDLKRAFPGSEITGTADANGVKFFRDGKQILVWTDPDVTSLPE